MVGESFRATPKAPRHGPVRWASRRKRAGRSIWVLECERSPRRRRSVLRATAPAGYSLLPSSAQRASGADIDEISMSVVGFSWSRADPFRKCNGSGVLRVNNVNCLFPPKIFKDPDQTTDGCLPCISLAPHAPAECPANFWPSPSGWGPGSRAAYPASGCLLYDREIAESLDSPGAGEQTHVKPGAIGILRTPDEACGLYVGEKCGPSGKISLLWLS